MSNLDQILNQLETCLTNQDVETCKPLLNQVKVAFLTTGNEKAAEGLECGVLLSLLEGDLEAFARLQSLLLPLYQNDTTSTTPKTKRRDLILGLHLMQLLVEHKLSEFHSILEVLPTAAADDNHTEDTLSPFLSYPISLERQLMVGFYDEIMSTPIPDPSYQFFVDNYLQQTVRDNIADGMEVSYTSLTLEEAAQRMKFATLQELEEYVQEFRADWLLSENEAGQKVISFAPVDSTTYTADDIHAQDWIQQSLQYATEMERIV